MPFVNVQTIKGIMTAEQKSELLRRMTDLLVEIEGQGDPQFRQSVWIRIDEHDPEQWSLGGVQPTAAMIAAKFAAARRDGSWNKTGGEARPGDLTQKRGQIAG